MNENSLNNAVTMRPDANASLGRIDQYELIRELGGGGFGCVYLARDTVAGIEVAVKGLPPLVRLNKEELENVRKNFALVSRLHHPNIAAALTLHPVTNAFYNDKTDAEKLRVFGGDTLVVMQYAPGVTLSQWRKQFPDGKVPLDKALEITRQIASALDYAHKERIIHRDIKPANVMIETLPDRTVTARVLDFGLAAEIRSSMGRLSLNVTEKSGTRHYMAPEQWSGKKQSKETDQYSLAALFYELILGEVPFASVFDTGDTVLMKTVVENDSPEIPSDLPKPIRRALSKGLAKEREDRFGSCIEFVDALQGVSGTGRASVLASRARGLRTSSRTFILAAVAALGLAVGGIFEWQQGLSDANGNAAREDARPPKNIVPASREDKEYAGPRRGDRKTLTLPGGATMTMIYVAPGSFMMGSPETEEGRDDDETQHHVTLTKGYWLGETEVTQAQWESVMGDNPSRFKSATHPVEMVSWEDCQKFIAKVNREARRQFGGDARLPTEAEWEYACRAGSRTALSNGKLTIKGKNNGPELDEVAWYGGNSSVGFELSNGHDCSGWLEKQYEGTKAGTHPVAKKTKNPWGFYDMHGNVWEWCQDWSGAYPSGAVTDPTGQASGVYRVLRGGCWYDYARYCRSAYRYWLSPGYRGNLCGFRLCCSAGPRE